MKKKTKILVGVGSAVALAAVGWFVFRPKKEEFSSKEESDESSSSSSSSSSSWKPSGGSGGMSGGGSSSTPSSTTVQIATCDKKAKFPLRKGDAGQQVRNVQKFLNKFGNVPVSEDCIYGKDTASAYDRFVSMKYKSSAKGQVSKLAYENVILPSLNSRDGKAVEVAAAKRWLYF